MYLAFLLTIVAYFVMVVITGKMRFKKLVDVSYTEYTRVKFRVKNIISKWVALVVVLAMCWFASISLADIGFRAISFDYNIWLTIIVLVLCGAVFLLFLYQAISPSHKKSEADNLGNPNKSNYSKAMEAIKPRTRKEKIAATGSAITAGIFEEILTRGFLFYLLQMQFPNLPIVAIVLITSVIFGVAHFYQGIQGIIMTTVAGLLLGFLFMVTGSLVLPIFLHFFVNFSSVFDLKEEKVV
ncbi:MAG: CPBP family intramembrane metalloprotease [Defluviitaleaceae bacterium]|nr:CPBP family intramembrane metalloprotease [Defluviitaleaceae bacterium]